MNCFCLRDYFTSSLHNLSWCLWHTAISFSLTCVSVPHKYFGLPTAERHISASVNETVMTKSSLMRFTTWLTSLFSLSAIPLIITTQAVDLKVFLDWNRAGWTSPCSKLVSLQQLLFTSPVSFQLDLVIWTSQVEHEHSQHFKTSALWYSRDDLGIVSNCFGSCLWRVRGKHSLPRESTIATAFSKSFYILGALESRSDTFAILCY